MIIQGMYIDNYIDHNHIYGNSNVLLLTQP